MKTIKLTNTDEFKAFVDDEDYEKANEHTWYLYKGRARSSHKINGQSIFLHHFILGKPEGKSVIRHKDGDFLDCRRDNLIQVTQSENARKSNRKYVKSSVYRGVSWDSTLDKWRVCLKLNGKSIHGGHFEDEVEAAKAYDAKAKVVYGEYATPNFPEESNQ